VFVGSKGQSGRKVHFGAFWSIFGLGMKCISMEQNGWMKLKIKEG